MIARDILKLCSLTVICDASWQLPILELSLILTTLITCRIPPSTGKETRSFPPDCILPTCSGCVHFPAIIDWQRLGILYIQYIQKYNCRPRVSPWYMYTLLTHSTDHLWTKYLVEIMTHILLLILLHTLLLILLHILLLILLHILLLILLHILLPILLHILLLILLHILLLILLHILLLILLHILLLILLHILLLILLLFLNFICSSWFCSSWFWYSFYFFFCCSLSCWLSNPSCPFFFFLSSCPQGSISSLFSVLFSCSWCVHFSLSYLGIIQIASHLLLFLQ